MTPDPKPGAKRQTEIPGLTAVWFITKDHKGRNGSGARSRPRRVLRAFFVSFVMNRPAVGPGGNDARLAPG